GWLLGEWEHDLDEAKTLVIEGDGFLSSLPGPALARSNGRFWSEDFAIRIRSGAGGRLANAGGLRGLRNALVVGAPAFSGLDDLVPLPDAKLEAEKVSAMFSRSILLTGQAATRRDVREQLHAAELFHFAGHGFGGDGGGLLLRGEQGGAELLQARDVDAIR